MAWAAIALLAATLGSLVAALFGLRGESRGRFGELRSEMREGFRAQGGADRRTRGAARRPEHCIDALGARIDTHLDRHAG